MSLFEVELLSLPKTFGSFCNREMKCRMNKQRWWPYGDNKLHKRERESTDVVQMSCQQYFQRIKGDEKKRECQIFMTRWRYKPCCFNTQEMNERAEDLLLCNLPLFRAFVCPDSYILNNHMNDRYRLPFFKCFLDINGFHFFGFIFFDRLFLVPFKKKNYTSFTNTSKWMILHIWFPFSCVHFQRSDRFFFFFFFDLWFLRSSK
jgi:hypothetical protein